MTAVNSVNKTKQAAVLSAGASNRIGMGNINAPLMVLYDSYDASSLASASTITFAALPLGARIVHIECAWEDLGSATTLDLGVVGATTKFFTNLDTSSAGSQSTGSVIPNIAGVGYVTTATTLSVIGTTDKISTGEIRLVVFYTMSS
jgi:hypothetical protein